MMACRGVFFAITLEKVEALLGAKDDEELKAVLEGIEDAWDEENVAECDKAWDAMHRALTDGRLEYGNGSYPLNHCVLGPRELYRGDDYIVFLVEADVVRDVAAALEAVTREWFETRYRTIVPKSYAPEYGEQDLEYTWEWLQGVRDLYRNAATRNRAVIFTVDQ